MAMAVAELETGLMFVLDKKRFWKEGTKASGIRQCTCM